MNRRKFIKLMGLTPLGIIASKFFKEAEKVEAQETGYFKLDQNGLKIRGVINTSGIFDSATVTRKDIINMQKKIKANNKKYAPPKYFMYRYEIEEIKKLM